MVIKETERLSHHQLDLIKSFLFTEKNKEINDKHNLNRKKLTRNILVFKSSLLIYIIKKSENLDVMKIIYFLKNIYILYVATDILSDATGYLFGATNDIFITTNDLSDATDI